MFISNSLLAIALFVAYADAQSSPPPDNAVNCTYHLIPQSDADGISLFAEVNYAIGWQTFEDAHATSGYDLLIPTPHLDGSVTATGLVAVEGLSKEEMKALVTVWPERKVVLTGWSGNGRIKWDVESVVCE